MSDFDPKPQLVARGEVTSSGTHLADLIPGDPLDPSGLQRVRLALIVNIEVQSTTYRLARLPRTLLTGPDPGQRARTQKQANAIGYLG